MYQIVKCLLCLNLLIFGSLSLLAQEFDGFALYSDRNNSYLIDRNGDIAHRWNCDSRNNYASFLKPNGNLVRGAVNQGNALNGAAVGGKVQEYTPDSEIVWEFLYSSSSEVAHHDICAMPDGGVLLTAWEVPLLSELQDLGYEGNTAKFPTHFVEVQQDGNNGKIVWEWHLMDHFAQDVDPTLPNYGVIAENPQLMNINVEIPRQGGGPPGGDRDWFHVNGVDYLAEYDQIIFSSRFLSEIFIIDHSTTSEEAASHSGGNSGMGGDLLWRWGNPSNYNTIGNRNISAAVHDARFIPDDGRINGGFVQIFNNEGLSGNSQVDAIELPRNGYVFDRQEDQAFGPEMASWTHNCSDNADGQSSADKLPNGNTYVNLSRAYMYEVDRDDNLVWQYSEGPSKGFRYTCDHPGIQQLIADGYIDAQLCQLSSTSNLKVNHFNVSPNPSKSRFYLNDIHNESELLEMSLLNTYGNKLKEYSTDMNEIDLSSFAPGVYFLRLSFKDGTVATKRLILSE